MDIKQKLGRLDPDNKKETTGSDSVVNKNSASSNQKESCPWGQVKETEAGSFVVQQKKYSPDYCQGLYHLNKFPETHSQDNLLSDRVKNYSREEILFLDTETTGLAGGTGTVPFLVGLGYFKGDNFWLKQFFMRDFEEETPLLLELKKYLAQFPLLVSFNGRSFDLPLIQNRLILNRYQQVEPEKHLDLLHEARRLWSHLASCSLASLEQNVLQVSRERDIPGHRVPEIYFNYLKQKESALMSRVFSHNRHDILTLVTLFTHLFKLYEGENIQSELDQDLSPEVLFRLGKVYEREKDFEQSIYFLARAYSRVESVYLKTKIEKKLSWQYKRVEKWDQAVTIWEEMLQADRGKLFPYRELAKFYEHQTREYSRAQKLTKQALAYLREKRAIIKNDLVEKDKLEHRLQRLNKKCSKQTKITGIK